MSRATDRRLQALERTAAPPRHITQASVVEAALVIRAGGSIPDDLAEFWTPAEVCKTADAVSERECRRGPT